jgi:hypothetical protein
MTTHANANPVASKNPGKPNIAHSDRTIRDLWLG